MTAKATKAPPRGAKATAKAKRKASPRPPPALLGVKGYARHRLELGFAGRSHTSVRRAIDSGRLVRSVSSNAKGRTLIDPVLADEEWLENTDPTEQRDPDIAAGGTPAHAPRLTDPNGVLFPELADDIRKAEAAAQEEEGPESPKAFRKAAAVRQGWLAKAAELDYLERAGKLVRVQEVEAEAYRRARQVRDALRRVPSRISAELAAIGSAHEVKVLLERELTLALEKLAADAR